MKFSDKKRVIQSLIFNSVESYIFVGLMGDDPMPYLDVINRTDFLSVILYEKDKKRFEIAKAKIELFPKYTNTILVYGNIMQSKLEYNNFYDFDFCTTIKEITKYLPEIVKVKQFSLTVSTRGYSVQDTKNIFKKYLRNDNFITIQYKAPKCAPMMVIYKY